MGVLDDEQRRVAEQAREQLRGDVAAAARRGVRTQPRRPRRQRDVDADERTEQAQPVLEARGGPGQRALHRRVVVAVGGAEQPAQRRAQGGVRRVRAVGGALEADRAQAFAVRDGDRVREQPRLPDAGLADELDDGHRAPRAAAARVAAASAAASRSRPGGTLRSPALESTRTEAVAPAGPSTIAASTGCDLPLTMNGATARSREAPAGLVEDRAASRARRRWAPCP